LKNIPGFIVQEHYPESTRQNHYCFGVRFDPDHFKNLPREKVVSALKAEGIMAEAGYNPLNKEPFLECSLNLRGFRAVFSQERLDKYRRENSLPQNDQLCSTAFLLEQNMLIGEKGDVDDVVEAFAKVGKNASLLA
jgi:dTDP-4-amino-4,6-dideoxygalactose transaminase